ncbi:hypothetical protein [Konateibacter massiliensis]|uniref:hypothetical protein n=1 Tax=Konateibacter massiliensis TaxID=2002841 RepID=UPI000C156286|nr:hypothetical protein [Konateibacter massiliensis]
MVVKIHAVMLEDIQVDSDALFCILIRCKYADNSDRWSYLLFCTIGKFFELPMIQKLFMRTNARGRCHYVTAFGATKLIRMEEFF